jgi:tetratricopeptide (TPR) repeat protein
VARAAEEEVDAFIIKPFSSDQLRISLLRAALLKISPPEYLKVIEEGKERLKNGKLDEASLSFERAKKLDNAPALAYAYVGQIDLMKKMLDQAQSNYLTGLSFNKIHYKCMVGIFDVLMEKNRPAEAYSVIKRIAQYFPANPKRLTQTLRLAIMTQSYDDIEKYYSIFTGLDDRNPEMIRYVCAALIVCGKYYLQRNIRSRALDLFQKATATSSASPKILREIITALIEHKLIKQAQEFFNRFTPKQQLELDYKVMQIALFEAEENPGKAVDLGRALINDGKQDPLLYEIVARCLMKAHLAPAAEQIVHSATQLWPKQSDRFKKLLQT